MKWKSILLWAILVHVAEACFDNGEFYCARLWYFWFVVFFVFVFMLVGAIIITNVCKNKKKKRRVGPRGGSRRKSKRRTNAVSRDSKASIMSKSTSAADTTDSPKLSNKFPILEKADPPPQVVDGEANFKRKGDKLSVAFANKDVSNMERGKSVTISDSAVSSTKGGALTNDKLPMSMVMEEAETARDNQDLDNANDTIV